MVYLVPLQPIQVEERCVKLSLYQLTPSLVPYERWPVITQFIRNTLRVPTPSKLARRSGY